MSTKQKYRYIDIDIIDKTNIYIYIYIDNMHIYMRYNLERVYIYMTPGILETKHGT